jgi:cysteine desulfurase
MLPYNTENFGNPHSKSHVFGWKAEEAVETARKVYLFDRLFF